LLARQAVLQGLGRVELGLFPLFLAWPALLMDLTVGAALANSGQLDASQAVVLNLISLGASLGLATALLRKHSPPDLHRARADRDAFKWLRAGAPLAAVAAVYLGGAQIGPILLGSLAEAREVAFFQGPARVTELLALVLMAFNFQLQPEAARLYSLGEFARIQTSAVRTARAALAFTVPVGALMIIFSDPILGVLGSAFVSADRVLALLVIAQLILATAAGVSVVLTMTGHATECAVGMAVGLLVNAVVSALLIPHLGAEGAAIGRVLDLLVWNVILAGIARRRLGVSVSAFSNIDGYRG